MTKIKCVIAAGGLGTRLQGFRQNDKTKILLEVNGMPMINRQINQINNWGIEEFIIITSPDFDELTREVTKNTFPNLNIFLNIESLLNVNLNNVINFSGSILWIVLLINAINFIDNMDGLAVVVTGSICYQSIILTYALNQNKLTDISVVLLFVILGFFIFNFPPAKLYLGDSGSLFIGFCLGFISILFTWNSGQQHTLSNTLSPLILFFTIPLLDFLIVLKDRVRRGVSPTTGGTDHISHRLLAKGLSEKKVLLIFKSYSIFNFLIILGYVFLNNILSMIALVIFVIQFVFLFNYIKKLEILK